MKENELPPGKIGLSAKSNQKFCEERNELFTDKESAEFRIFVGNRFAIYFICALREKATNKCTYKTNYT